MCVWVQVCQSTQVEAKRSTDNLQESVLSFLYMDSRAWTQVDRHGSKRLYPFGHFDCPYSPKVCMLHSFFFLNFPPFLFDSSLYSKDIWDHFIFKTSLLPISFVFILWLLFLLHCYVQRLICLLILNYFIYSYVSVHTCVCAHVPCSTCIQYLERLEENFGCELKLWAAVSHRCEYWVPNVGSLEPASIPNYWGIFPSLLCTLTFMFGVTALGYTYTLLVCFVWAKRFQCGTLTGPQYRKWVTVEGFDIYSQALMCSLLSVQWRCEAVRSPSYTHFSPQEAPSCHDFWATID